MLLAPWKWGVPAPRDKSATRTADDLVAEIPRGVGKMDVFLRAHDGRAEFDGYELDGRAALLRYEGTTCTSLFAAGCRRVAARGQDVLRVDPAAAFVAAQRRGPDLWIDCVTAKAVWLGLPEPRRCIVNGKPAKWEASDGGVLFRDLYNF